MPAPPLSSIPACVGGALVIVPGLACTRLEGSGREACACSDINSIKTVFSRFSCIFTLSFRLIVHAVGSGSPSASHSATSARAQRS
eukprot:6023557-Prymnesium_polylepis.1